MQKACAIGAVLLPTGCSFFRDVEPAPAGDAGAIAPDSGIEPGPDAAPGNVEGTILRYMLLRGHKIFLPTAGEYTVDYEAESTEYLVTIEFDDFSPLISVPYDSTSKVFGSSTHQGISQFDIILPGNTPFIARLAFSGEPDFPTSVLDPSIVAFEPATGDVWISTASSAGDFVHDLIIPAGGSNRYMWLAIRMNAQWELTWE